MAGWLSLTFMPYQAILLSPTSIFLLVGFQGHAGGYGSVPGYPDLDAHCLKILPAYRLIHRRLLIRHRLFADAVFDRRFAVC